ncbi:hypothetical protein ASG54_03285 [Aureimonas sp. Leaf460]|nr:hypothetical protein ASG62_21320 [Aureimonas sp. Leaf427]KQT78058.1 hypothetical protein ASG54_03285 [Aureimonas sp. Leaf460]
MPMGEAAQPPLATLAPPQRHVAGSGHVVALTQVAVQSRRGGTIVELVADVGDAVTVGQMLLRLDAPDLRFALRATELARRRAELALAARRLDAADAEALGRRMAALAESGTVNGQSARDAGTAAERSANFVDQAAESLAEAELAVSKARQAIDELTIRAPIAGVVSVRAANLGEMILAQVDARDDALLFTITDPARLAVDIDIAETNVAAVQPGLKGEAILDAYPDRPFAVMVQRVAPVASAERGTLALRLAILDPPVGIRPAMAVRVSLFLDAPTAAGAITSNITGP